MQLRRLPGQVALYALAGVIVAESVFPFYYAIIASLSTGIALFEPLYAPLRMDLANYTAVWQARDFGRSMLNSLVIASTTVAVALALSLTAAYALSRVKFRGRGLLLTTILATSMIPQVALLAGFYELVRALGLFNTPWALILSYTVFTLPFVVWFLTATMRDLPLEMEEAAIIDGATPWDLVLRVFLPMMWPVVLTSAIMAFVAAWNEFLFALVFTVSETRRTVPIAILMFGGESPHEVPWGPIMAASVLVTLPLVVLVMLFQNRIIAGLQRVQVNA